jgi:hypothetical protein
MNDFTRERGRLAGAFTSTPSPARHRRSPVFPFAGSTVFQTRETASTKER